ncbi:1-hydroxycarotenoid 3,4-desaturase CrtD [Natronoflexus pectinivorans]|uniref:Phytoene desaturase n=1 Tax=Natronoflexus pectinivorans TaxID=682526 RepID=A0A4V2RWS9_9BACT|nr:1-hydroxycarotenoid 3,4-desaturase CrtD [Natronoflexus pectinivorans]TCO09851.1 phytoene desaturase [Natronoflexus pectinivorans]
MSKKAAIIIGAGIGGIAAALRLAAKGYDVSVLEKNSEAGGKMAQFTQKGYRFDMGPSLFTLPHLVEELFALFGKRMEDYLGVVELPMTCNYFFPDGKIIKAWSNRDKFLDEVQNSGVSRQVVEEYLEKQSFLYTHTADFFLFNSIHKPSTFVGDAGKKSLKALHKLDVFTSMHQRNKRTFGESYLVRLFDRYATYNGSDPYRAPATLNMIAHLEHNTGAWFPKNGMYGILNALKKLAEEEGVRFLFNTEVIGLVTSGREVTGVRTGDCIYPASLVVNNTDITLFYRDILPNNNKLRKLMKRERSSSALIFYWGMKVKSELDVHNILFSNDYEAEFIGLFKTKLFADDLTVYIFISNKVVPDDAPNGCENWFVMVNAPENVGQDWQEEATRARELIISKINTVLNMDVEKVIEFEQILTPEDIEERTGSVHGSLYGHSSNSPLAAFLRHPNFSRRYKNLYFTGGSVHPGGGIPLCLASAKIVDGMID